MTAVLAGGLYLPPSHPDIGPIARRLRVRNAAHDKFLRSQERGSISRWAEPPPEYVGGVRDFPAGHQWRGGGIVPRSAPGLPEGWTDRRTDGTPFDVKVSGSPRGYQTAAVDELLREDDGVVVAPCGSGKTQIGIYAIARAGRSALVLVHTLDLLRQWQDRARSVLGVDAGVVGGGREDVQPLTVATMQTLASWEWWRRYELGRRFGVVVVDECHRAPCESMCDVLSSMPARRRIGLSATPDREDGLTPLMHWHLGPVRWRIDHAELVRRGSIVLPAVRVVATGYEATAPTHTGRVTEASESPERNELIRGLVRGEVAEGRQVLVLCARVEHCTTMAAGVGEALVGSMPAKARADVLDRARRREVSVLWATSLADEALDLPSLDTVILAEPGGPLPKLEQRIGRVMRPGEGKTPRVYDLVDEGAAWGAHRRRQGLYSRLGLQVRRFQLEVL